MAHSCTQLIGGVDRMNAISGTMMVFSVLLLVFFGLPLMFFFLFSRIFPAKLEQPMEPVTTNEETYETLGVPITIKKVRKNGNIIWVDATE